MPSNKAGVLLDSGAGGDTLMVSTAGTVRLAIHLAAVPKAILWEMVLAKTPAQPDSTSAHPTDAALHSELRAKLAASALPGEGTPSAEQLDAAASLLLATAHSAPTEPRVQISTGGERGRHLRIAAANPDMPFLVDSIAAAVASHGLPIDQLLHPVVHTQRNADGILESFSEGGDGTSRESLIYLETPRLMAKERRALEASILDALANVHAAVEDWGAMRTALQHDAAMVAKPELTGSAPTGGVLTSTGPGAAPSEEAELLRWLADDHMTQLGHLVRRRDGQIVSPLGICRVPGAEELLTPYAFERAFAWFEEAGHGAQGTNPSLLVLKSHCLSRVHRRVPMDLYITPVQDERGIHALSVHAGIWTSAALNEAPQNVPVLRHHAGTIMEELGVSPNSHDGKALIHALSNLPHDLMLSLPTPDVTQVVTAMMALTERPRPRCVLVEEALERLIFAFVWLPRDMLSTSTRLQVQSLLEDGTSAHLLDWTLVVEGGNLAMLRFTLERDKPSAGDSAGEVPVASAAMNDPLDRHKIDQSLQELLRGWPDAVEQALLLTESEGRAAALALKYAEEFPATYRTRYGAGEAAQDIARMRLLHNSSTAYPMGREVRLYPLCDDTSISVSKSGVAQECAQIGLKIYQANGFMPLSAAVPALENFGFAVQSEFPTELTGATGTVIHDFHLNLRPGTPAQHVLDRAEEVEEAIRSVVNGLAEDDVFNELVTYTQLNALETDGMRGVYRYLRQTGSAFTISTVVSALASAPAVLEALLALFSARHDPHFAQDRVSAAQAAEDQIRHALASVTAINDDRVLRLYWAIVNAILRTNAFAPAGREALAFKFDSSQIPGLPKPVPWREIFVYSRRVEGIHLRAGPVARGGLRWSDRRDDFRTEVLGLMKAQRVKNAVIVPTGAKGGFYPKALPNPAVDRAAWAAEGKESYKIFIRSLLSVTDNIVDDRVVHPADVVVHDGEDPYFVVAADKGTASFSDTANALADEANFWLHDAFASGGSIGYDHKEMGITARGAWVSVQRHFQEIGVDVQSEPVLVAGCGDMSGDVFGNGMLQSKAIKLVAAFDHRHIFIDPNPEPEAAWAERKRLFELPASSWADYNTDLMSKGSGVYPRTLKSITLSPEAQAVLGLSSPDIEPEQLIRAVLMAPVDLLFFGGIGTYIKAESEAHTQVGDPSNDALRVNGSDLRAKIVGEGANLGVTQAGRIEFALKGGRINTDFIDNSAGVDCSDNEVNIKIALAAAQSAGRLSEEERRSLLAAMTDEVAQLVLEDNRLQALALSIAERGGPAMAPSHIRLIDTLEDLGGLDRKTEGLADSQSLTRRAVDGHGLTRPELAVLLSNAKLALQAAIELSNLSQDSAADPLVLNDFAPAMQDRFSEEILHHRLRNEIVATAIANQMINRMGLVHPYALAEEEGVPLDQVASVFVACTQLLNMGAIWEAIEHQAMPEAARLLLFEQSALALRNHMADMLRSNPQAAAPSVLVANLRTGVAGLHAVAGELQAPDARSHSDAIRLQLTTAGAPESLAQSVTELFILDGGIGLVTLAGHCGADPLALAHSFVKLGAELGLDWAQTQASSLSPSDPWERLLTAGLARDFQQMRFDFLRQLLQDSSLKQDPQGYVDAWVNTHAGAISQFRTVISRARSALRLTPAMLAQIAGQARGLLQRSAN